MIDLMLKYFRGRADHVAVADDGKTFRPEPYAPRAEFLQSHIAGERCYGFYFMQPDNTVWCSAVDFDNKPDSPDPAWRDKADLVYYRLANIGLSPLVELSQSGTAAHVWLFFSEPIDAWLIRAFWRGLATNLDMKFNEVYPRQDQLTGKGIGNLMRYPLWGQSRFVEVESEWATIDPATALGEIKTTDATELKVLAFEIGAGTLKPEAPLLAAAPGDSGLSARIRNRLLSSHSLLARRWAGDMEGLADASRSALVLSIACELVRTYVPTPEIEHAIKVWCDEHGYDKGNRHEWIAGTVAKAYDLLLSRSEQKSVSIMTMEQACHAYLDSLHASGPRCVASGVRDVDRSIDGVGFGEMAVIAARPSHGKSAFALQWLHNAAANGLPCLIISEEMAATELGKRATLALSEIEEAQHKVRDREIRTQVNDHYAEKKSIHIQENCHTIERCCEVIDQMCENHGVRVVAVDYLQLLRGRDAKRYEAVSEISQRLKQSARSNNCAILALSQLSRAIDSRDKHEPQLSDLRESGQIEQDADLVLFLQWPLRYSIENDPDTYLIYAKKRRNGPIRCEKIVTRFNPERQTIGMPKPTPQTLETWRDSQAELIDEDF